MAVLSEPPCISCPTIVEGQPFDQDAEITAMSAVAKALEPLDELARQWVISWTASRFGAPLLASRRSLAAADDCIESSAVLKYGKRCYDISTSRASDRQNGGMRSGQTIRVSRPPYQGCQPPPLPLDYQLTS